MKNLKKLFLSATTIIMAAGAVDSAQAFRFFGFKETINVAPQQISQPKVEPNSIPAIQAQIPQKFYLGQPALQILHQLQASNQLLNLNHESKDAFSFLIQKLIPIFAILSQNDDNPEEINKLRTQFIEFLQEFNAMRQVQQNAAPLQKKATDELQVLMEEIKALKEEVKRLQDSQLGLINSVSALNTKGNDDVLPAELPSDTFRSMNVSTQPETSNSTASVEKPTVSTSALTSKEDTSSPQVLHGVMTTLPSDIETSSPIVLPPLASEDPSFSFQSKPWVKEEFEQNVLGIKPINLSGISEAEKDLWRTFTVLRFAGSNEKKQWSTWGGAFSTAELEEKFKGNTFMEKAFKDISALNLPLSTPVFFPEYAQYFVVTSPNTALNPEKDADLVKAYYFRGLYRVLTGNNYNGKTFDSSAAEFKIDLKTGIKGSHFNYGSRASSIPQYETSIYEAEEYFKDTPWHTLFINKVKQAAFDSLPNPQSRIKEITELYTKEFKELLMLAEDKELDHHDQIAQPITTDTQAETQELSTKQFTERMLKLTSEKNEQIEAINSQVHRLLKATSLRDIDEALGIS